MTNKWKLTKRIFSFLLIAAMLLVAVPAPQAAAADNYYNVAEYRSGDTFTAPEKAGHVFAGWYADAEFTTPLRPHMITGKAYAKFVDEAVLSVKWQLNAGISAESETANLRILTTVDSLDYQQVGFAVEAEGKEDKNLVSTSVYTSIYGYTGENGVEYQPSIFSEESKYFQAFTLTDIPESDFFSNIKVTPKWTTLDGTEVNGVPLSLTVNDGIPFEGLPKLYFEGNIAGMETKEDVRDISVRFVSGEQRFQGFAELKLQGGSSLDYDKKNYNIKLFKDDAHESKLKVDMGWGKENKYCLKANWVDKTHSRNLVTAELAREAYHKYGIFDNAPTNCTVDGFPIEIYSNGEFLGLYTFNIPKDEWLFAMDDEDPNHIVMESTDWKDSNLFKAMPNYETGEWAVEVGAEDQTTYDKLDRVFDFVLNSSDADFRANFENYLDLKATLNYIIFIETAFMGDNVGKNMLLVTYDGQKWYPCLYDMDTTWGPQWTGLALNNYRTGFVNAQDNYLFQRIKKNFPQELARQYFELRGSVLTKDNIMGKFETFKAQIPAEVFQKEAARWGSIPGYDISQIEEYLDIMLPRLDTRYLELQQG